MLHQRLFVGLVRDIHRKLILRALAVGTARFVLCNPFLGMQRFAEVALVNVPHAGISTVAYFLLDDFSAWGWDAAACRTAVVLPTTLGISQALLSSTSEDLIRMIGTE